ncbi:hypothetical protein Ciccas_012202 [Cichlidogyrus casuarinus]|uniref:DUF4781 domain-containing protein n=1 Tax=Cichlidogyrus casuarinus TaxID=1844966 RepID=A0ABD2PRD0_9PLAT
MDASNYSEFKNYANNLFSRQGSSFGAADFDQLFDESYLFYDELLTHMQRLFAADQIQLELLKKLERSCINPLWLKVAYLMFGAPELTEEKTLYTEEEQEVINKVCSVIKNQYKKSEVLFNCLYAITRTRRSKLAHHHILFKVRNPDLTMSQQVFYIDRNFRVYPSWKDFLEDNKLSPMHNKIFIPEKGRYVCKDSGKVRKERRKNFWLNKAKEALTYAAGVLSGVSGLIALSMGIAKIVDKARHGEKNPRNYVWAAIDLTVSVASVASSFVGVGLAATIARESRVAMNVFRGFRAVLTIGGGIACLIVGNTVKLMRQPERLVIPGLESQTTPEIQEMFSSLSPQYQMMVNQYVIMRHKFKSGTLTISDFLEFNSMLLIEFNVLDWTLTSSLLQSQLLLPTCSQPRKTVSITYNSTKEISFKDKTENPHPQIRLLNEKSAKILETIDRFRLCILEIERKVSVI